MRRKNEKDVLSQVHREKTPLYSDLDISYQQAYSGPYTPLDFNGVVAALKDNQITGYGRPMVGDLPRREIKRLYDISPNIWYQDFLEGGNLTNISKFLLEMGATATPYFTQIIDLTKSEEELHADIRKSYTSLINAGQHSHNLFIADYYTAHRNRIPQCNTDDIEPFRKLHKKICGRETRNRKTWDIQQKQIEEGQAFAVLAWSPPGYRKELKIIKEEFLGGALFIYNRHSCYYAVAASLPNVNSHALIWEAILHAKKLGCANFELGEQMFLGDEKVVGISHFKRGFGGECKCYLRIKSGKENQ